MLRCRRADGRFTRCRGVSGLGAADPIKSAAIWRDAGFAWDSNSTEYRLEVSHGTYALTPRTLSRPGPTAHPSYKPHGGTWVSLYDDWKGPDLRYDAAFKIIQAHHAKARKRR